MKKIEIKTLGDTIKVVERNLEKENVSCRGYWNPKTGEIVIDSRLDEADKYAVLIHEYMHLIDDIMIQNGIYKKRTPHIAIESIADNLLVLLVLSGLFKGLTKEDAMNLYGKMGDMSENEAKTE